MGSYLVTNCTKWCIIYKRNYLFCRSRAPSKAMERYERLARLGEGSYGVVFQCRDRQTGKLVAVKKFQQTEDDPLIRKIALREIRLLKVSRYPEKIKILRQKCPKSPTTVTSSMEINYILDKYF